MDMSLGFRQYIKEETIIFRTNDDILLTFSTKYFQKKFASGF